MTHSSWYGSRCNWMRHWAAVSVLAFTDPIGCSASPSQQSARSVLPRFTPDDAVLFDDSFAGEVLGIQSEGSDGGAKLKRRTERADGVLAVRVSTVTRAEDGVAPGYQLVLEPVAPSLAGAPADGPIAIGVDPTSASYAFVMDSETALVGQRFVLFWRRYGTGGQAVLHWHAVGDSPELRLAITQLGTGRRVSQ